MIVRQYAPCSLGRSIIRLGKQGEINALRVEFDVSAWMAMYPDATVKLMHFAPDRPQDNPVIPTLGVEGTLRVWIVGEEDTANSGNGVIELLLIDERTGSTIKSATGYTTVLRSPSAGIEAQEPEPGYVRYDVDQSALLTDTQKAFARTNIDAIKDEKDPTVPDWAKQPRKPTYTASEVGALPSSYTPPVTSVNGKTGEVALSAQDVGARPDTWTPSSSEVGADAAGTASGAVAAHNTSGAAHTDLRALIEGLNSRLNALADSDDTTLDQISEIVAYIKSNKTLIDAVTTGKVSVSDIVDNLTTNASGKVLSAAQGVALKAMIDGIVIPTALPNPQPITINGQRYDGSEAVTVTTVEIDDTLTQSGKAADAKAVGDQLNELNEATAEEVGQLKDDLTDLAVFGKTEYGDMKLNPSTFTRDGMTVIIGDDNTITINGTATTGNLPISTDAEITFNGLTDVPEQYYISFEKISGDFNYNNYTFEYPNINIQIGDEQQKYIDVTGTFFERIRNVYSSRIVFRLNFGGTGAVANNLKFRIWVNKGIESIPYGYTTETQLNPEVIPKLLFLKPNIITVGNTNCDYTEVQDAIHGITDDSATNPYTIIVYPGIYERISFNKDTSGGQDYPNRYISIIGINRKDCIIQSRIGTYHEPAAEIRTNGIIKNLSFITKHDMGDATELSQSAGYGVHVDFGFCDLEFDNCYIESDMNNALGAGTYNNSSYKFKNCIFVNKRKATDTGLYGGENASYRGAIIIHTGSNADWVNQKVWIENCVAITEDSNVLCNLMNISGTENYEFTFINNMFMDKTHGKVFVNKYDKTVNEEVVSYYIRPSIYSYGNNNPSMDYQPQ